MGNSLHVVIVGAGFGGLGVFEQFTYVPVNVTLIDRHNYHTFQPLLYQVVPDTMMPRVLPRMFAFVQSAC
jgi:NADH dehydrogenase